MNPRARGVFVENLVARAAEELGYVAFAARGSRGKADLVCFPHTDKTLVPLVIQVGSGRKPVAATLGELWSAPRPIGSLCIVARYCKQRNRRRKWKFHTLNGTFDSLEDAIGKGTN